MRGAGCVEEGPLMGESGGGIGVAAVGDLDL